MSTVHAAFSGCILRIEFWTWTSVAARFYLISCVIYGMSSISVDEYYTFAVGFVSFSFHFYIPK